MDTKDNGGPAFPCEYEGSTRSDASGLSIRGYFAAKAMGAFIYSGWEGFGETVADAAYKMADDMLAERAK